jgi:hypothetical protein
LRRSFCDQSESSRAMQISDHAPMPTGRTRGSRSTPARPCCRSSAELGEVGEADDAR